MNYTEKEIELCKRLHNLGVRPEIREGDWVLVISKGKETKQGIFYITNLSGDYIIQIDKFHSFIIPQKDRAKRIVLLFSWERCREWLRERGWQIIAFCGFDRDQGTYLVFQKCSDDSIKEKDGSGATDLEAILSVMVQIVEGEKR